MRVVKRVVSFPAVFFSEVFVTRSVTAVERRCARQRLDSVPTAARSHSKAFSPVHLKSFFLLVVSVSRCVRLVDRCRRVLCVRPVCVPHQLLSEQFRTGNAQRVMLV